MIAATDLNNSLNNPISAVFTWIVIGVLNGISVWWVALLAARKAKKKLEEIEADAKRRDEEAKARAGEIIRLAQEAVETARAVKTLGEATHALVNGQSVDVLQVAMVSAAALAKADPTEVNLNLAQEAVRKYESKRIIVEQEEKKS